VRLRKNLWFQAELKRLTETIAGDPFRDSVACTIVMRWQRRFKSCFSASQLLF
jgi:hypothetical protein